MKNQYQRTMIGLVMLLSMLFSVNTQAHTSDSGAGIFGAMMHLFSGEHVVALILIAVVSVTMWRFVRDSSTET